MKSEHSNTIHTHNSKWIKDLNARNHKIPRRKHRPNTDKNHSKIFFDPPFRVMKIKINKWNLIKLKNFLHSRGNHI